MPEVFYSITIAAKKAGLSTHVIRVWEKRYDAVAPNRTDSNQRRYSDADINRLRLLSTATKAGHRIGDIAQLKDDALVRLVAESSPPPPAQAEPLSPAAPIESALQAIRNYDSLGLLRALEQASVQFGQHGLLQIVIGPLAQRIGVLWQDGHLTAAHEHFATATIRDYLLKHSHPFAESENTPRLIVATPAGQLHELGAAMVAAAARDMGWAIVYLGVNLPAAEIASAVIKYRAQAVALSIVYPGDDPKLEGELLTLRKLLPPDIRIIAGGRAVEAYADVLEKIGTTYTLDLNVLYGFLDRTRRPARPAIKPEA